MTDGIYDESMMCDICKARPVAWLLENETEHWDFYPRVLQRPVRKVSAPAPAGIDASRD